jgi:hypothetical protein
MNADDSIYLGEFTKRFNDHVVQGLNHADIDTIAIENEIIGNTNIVPAEILRQVRIQDRKVRKARRRTATKVRRDISKHWRSAFDSLNELLAVANLINARLVQAVFMNGEILRSKNPSPLADMVTGAHLKCLHLLALYGKSCRIATEISHLLQVGFPDAAASRLRTLYEHLVIMMLLLNDSTYELSERYQESAVFEYIKQLKNDQDCLVDPFWRTSDAIFEKLAKEISDLDITATEIITRRGPKIKGQHEWARPALPEVKKNNPKYRINFTDLEEVAGADFLRTFYLLGNDRIHAGAYGAINHFDFDDPHISLTRQRRDDWMTHLIGSGASTLMSWAARAACKGIAWETEEYDEMLYMCVMQRIADAAVEAFSESRASPLSPT